MEFKRQFALIVACAAVASQILAGCAGSRAGGGAPGAAPGATAAATPPGGSRLWPRVAGTSDPGGGCTGTAHACYDSYIEQPERLPAYQNLVIRWILNFRSPDGLLTDSNLISIMRLKTWYFGPFELESIDPSTLGVGVLRNEAEQIAVQTKLAIWFDKRAYDAMENDEKRATAVLHEIVMTAYFLKFRKMSDIMNGYARSGSYMAQAFADARQRGELDPATLDANMPPPEAERPLNEADNENIRFIVAYLKSHADARIPQVEFLNLMLARGFDPRIFRPANVTGQSDSLTPRPPPSAPRFVPTDRDVSRDVVMGALRAAELTGSAPTRCFGLSSNVQANCRLEFADVALANGLMHAREIRVVGPEGRVLGRFRVAVGSSTARLTNFVSSLWYLPSIDDIEAPKLGERRSVGFLVFAATATSSGVQYELHSLVTRPLVVTSVRAPGQAPDQPRCEARAPEPGRAFENEPISVRRVQNQATLIDETIMGMTNLDLCPPPPAAH